MVGMLALALLLDALRTHGRRTLLAKAVCCQLLQKLVEASCAQGVVRILLGLVFYHCIGRADGVHLPATIRLFVGRLLSPAKMQMALSCTDECLSA